MGDYKWTLSQIKDWFAPCGVELHWQHACYTVQGNYYKVDTVLLSSESESIAIRAGPPGARTTSNELRLNFLNLL